mmetsp:Transcript_21121/g.32749  ORF Transcript_21121/g.32749 Transcript_21121/m.32749 type:complete len:170 (-) Transcript_21121:1459-1968(-)
MKTPYQCEVILTNISSSHKKATVLFQVPYGALPLGDSKYIDSQQVGLQSFTTRKVTFKFYFPQDGAFKHPPSNISDSVVEAMSPCITLDVGKRRVITKVETFEDIMMTTPTDDEKKAKILELLRTRERLLPEDSEFKFRLDDILFLTYKDPAFFLEVLKITSGYMFYSP